LVNAAGGEFDDIALWRLERDDDGPVVRQFAGQKVLDGIVAGEIR